jgi:predicted transcriptional regulator of viral defense system
VIALASALAHYGLTTFVPSEVYVAIPLSDKPPRISFPPIRFFYYPERFYHAGIEEIKTQAGKVRIYNKEKTICDMFRYRNKIGENLALEALKNYLRRRDADIGKLNEYAVICQVKTVMLPYVKAMVS